jgi:hypothetical protein
MDIGQTSKMELDRFFSLYDLFERGHGPGSSLGNEPAKSGPNV